MPDYMFLVLSVNNSFEQVKEQIEIAIALQSNFSIVVTHIDKYPKSKKDDMVKYIRDICFQYDDFIPLIVRNKEDAVYFAKSIKEPILPIFYISNVTGENLQLLKDFLHFLPLEKNDFLQNQEEKSEFIVQDKFLIEKKIILCGWVFKGMIRKNQKLYIGPLSNLKFK